MNAKIPSPKELGLSSAATGMTGARPIVSAVRQTLSFRTLHSCYNLGG
jgi:hypothetical protein